MLCYQFPLFTAVRRQYHLRTKGSELSDGAVGGTRESMREKTGDRNLILKPIWSKVERIEAGNEGGPKVSEMNPLRCKFCRSVSSISVRFRTLQRQFDLPLEGAEV